MFNYIRKILGLEIMRINRSYRVLFVGAECGCGDPALAPVHAQHLLDLAQVDLHRGEVLGRVQRVGARLQIVAKYLGYVVIIQ